jgi:hypothetical protein
MTIAVASGKTMETITPTPLTRLKIPNAHPEAVPENPPEGFAQVMARQEKFSRPKEKPVGLDRKGVVPKTPLTPKEKSKQKKPDPANDPQVTSSLTAPISNTVLPNPPSQPGEPPADLEDPTFSLKLKGQTSNPVLASKDPTNPGSEIQPGPGDTLITGVKPQDSLQPGTAGEIRGPVFIPGLLAQVREDLRVTSETGPAGAPALVQPEGTSKETPVVSKAVEDLLLHPTPESLPIKQEVSPEKTEIAIRSFQTTTEKGPSFSPQGPAIPKTTLKVDGLDPSPSLILRKFALKGQDSETTAALEIKPDSQASPLEALTRTEKVATAPIVEGPSIAEPGDAESIFKAIKISAMAASPATSKEIPSSGEIAPWPKPEGLPDPEKASPTISGLDSKTSILHRTLGEKVEPGLPLRDSRENLSGSGGPGMNNPIRFQEDTPLGAIAKFLDQPRVEGIPVDRVVEEPPKGSPEWIKEAQSVYQQFSKGLLQTLQHSGERIQMTLDPPQLGNILLEINRDRSSVTAHLWTDNPLTKELLEFSQGQLQKTLELDGFKLDRFEVQVQPDLKSFQEERWFGGRQPSWENNREGARREAAEGVILSPLEAGPLRFSQGNQYVDTWV